MGNFAKLFQLDELHQVLVQLEKKEDQYYIRQKTMFAENTVCIDMQTQDEDLAYKIYDSYNREYALGFFFKAKHKILSHLEQLITPKTQQHD